MALPAWDSSVPSLPILSTWKLTPYLAPIASEMEGGNLRLRRRPGDNVAIIEQSVKMTQAQYNSFKTFLDSTIFGGVSRFTVSLWLGTGCATKTAQFSEPPTPSFLGANAIIIAMKLRVYDA